MVKCDDSGSSKPPLRLVAKDPEAYWTAADVADYLKVSETTVTRLRQKSGLPSFVLPGRLRRFKPSAVRAWAAEQEGK